MSEGDILVADFHAFGGPGGVIRVDPVSGARTTVSAVSAPPGGPSFLDPADVEVEADGRVLVADFSAFGAAGGVIRVNPSTGSRTTVSSNTSPAGGPAFVTPSGLAIEPDGDVLVADRNAFGGGGGVIRVDPVSGARTTVSATSTPAGGPAFVEPAGLTLAGNGDILVADEDAFGGTGGIIRVHPVTGARTALSANGAPAGGPSFEEPVGIAVTAGGALLVTDEDAFADAHGGVIRVDPLTGARTTVSANGAPAAGPSFGQPYGIAMSPNGSVLVVDFEAFDGSGGVIRVDPGTGARTRVSTNGEPAGGPSFFDPLGIALLSPGPQPPPVYPTPTRVDRVAPVITAASVRPRVFAVAGRRTRRRTTRGTTFRYRLSERARVRFVLQRRTRGRLQRGRCRRPARVNRRGRRCTRLVAAGSFTQAGAAGPNRRRFTGRVRGRALRPGRYRATLRATDAAGNRSLPRRLAFRVTQ